MSTHKSEAPRSKLEKGQKPEAFEGAEAVRAVISAGLEFCDSKGTIVVGVDKVSVQLASEEDVASTECGSLHESEGGKRKFLQELKDWVRVNKKRAEVIRVEQLLVVLAIISFATALAINTWFVGGFVGGGDQVAVFELQLQLSKAEACMPRPGRESATSSLQTTSQRRQDAIHRKLLQFMDESAVKGLQIMTIIVDMADEACLGLSGRSKRGADISTASADLQVVLFFNSAAQRSAFDSSTLATIPGVRFVFENNSSDRVGLSASETKLAAMLAALGGVLLILGAWLVMPTRRPEVKPGDTAADLHGRASRSRRRSSVTFRGRRRSMTCE